MAYVSDIHLSFFEEKSHPASFYDSHTVFISHRAAHYPLFLYLQDIAALRLESLLCARHLNKPDGCYLMYSYGLLTK